MYFKVTFVDGADASSPLGARAAEEARHQRNRDELDLARRLGGTLDKSGQFLDPDNEKER